MAKHVIEMNSDKLDKMLQYTENLSNKEVEIK